MNDFDYDCLQKKKVARSAAYKKRGSHSKACSLPSDHLTQKQLRERCSDVIAFSFSEPMGWKKFKTLSKETQEEYLNNLHIKFGANSSNFAEMFNVAPPTVRRYLGSRGIDLGFKVGHSMTNAQRDLWEKFIHEDESEQPTESSMYGTVKDGTIQPDTSIMPAEKKEASVEKHPEGSMGLDKFDITFSGVIDAGMIANSLHRILGSNSKGKVYISCEIAHENSCEI